MMPSSTAPITAMYRKWVRSRFAGAVSSVVPPVDGVCAATAASSVYGCALICGSVTQQVPATMHAAVAPVTLAYISFT
ncbi:hypothetical protein HOK021_59560 [Streptomyces hygroscopicus]|nr:hypothetical protein HOK021_59560 [Streptomyces hygroscopicus]